MATATRLSFDQLKDLWVQAGGSAATATIAAAIAMAESGGNPDSINDKNSNGTIDRGLWQINSVHGVQSTLDPVANARAAVAISKGGTDWHPWCVAWSNGACGGTFLGDGSPVLKYIPQGEVVKSGSTATGDAQNALVSAQLSGTTSWIQDLVGWIADQLGITDVIKTIARYIGYVLMVALGLLLIAGGVVMLVLSTRTARAASRAATGRALGIPGSGQIDVAVWEDKKAATTRPVSEAAEPAPTPGPVYGPDDLAPPIAAPKDKPYKPKHYVKVKKASSRTVIPKRGDAPDDWPTTPNYKPKH